MKILITGCCGHIGSHFVRRFRGHEIVGLDNMMTQRYASLFNLPRKIKFIEDDHLDLEGFNSVIHLAGLTNAALSNKSNMRDAYSLDEYKTRMFIRQVAQVAKNERRQVLFVFPSSTSIYGTNKSLVSEDDMSVVNPQSVYAKQKYRLEGFLKQQVESSSYFNYVIARFGTIFGTSPGMRFHTAINKFCWQATTGQKLTIWKENYNQVRPYLGLEDAFQFVNSLLRNKMAWNQTYNVLSDNYLLSDVVEDIRRASKRKIEIELVETPLLNQHTYNVSLAKAHSIGFKPKCKLRDGIKETMKTLKGINK